MQKERIVAKYSMANIVLLQIQHFHGQGSMVKARGNTLLGLTISAMTSCHIPLLQSLWMTHTVVNISSFFPLLVFSPLCIICFVHFFLWNYNLFWFFKSHLFLKSYLFHKRVPPLSLQCLLQHVYLQLKERM